MGELMEKCSSAVSVKVTESEQRLMLDFLHKYYPDGSQSELMRMSMKLLIRKVQKDGGFMNIVRELVE